VPLKNEDVAWILLHIETQHAQGGGNLAERMNHYRCLIYAHYRREPVALAIVTSGKRKKEKYYSHSHYGTEIVYRYNNLVLTDLDDEELQASDNPIDLALYAAKCALRTKEENKKYKYLRILIDQLAERGWNNEDKRDLLLFLERVIDLRDKELEKQYTEYRNRLNKEGKIVYIPLGERELAREIEQRGMEKGIEKGMKKGMEKGKEEMARNLIAIGISPDIIAQSAGLPLERIQSLLN
jgi:predicted transposase YdaD